METLNAFEDKLDVLINHTQTLEFEKQSLYQQLQILAEQNAVLSEKVQTIEARLTQIIQHIDNLEG